MDIINSIMSGGNIISENNETCLLSPSIKCDDDINLNYNLYSSKIMTEDDYERYITKYKQNSQIDPNYHYLIELPNKECKINHDDDKIEECSKLPINKSLKNIITEESYTLDDYIKNPEILEEFILVEPNFFKIFLFEFKNLFEGLKFLASKNIIHHDISPKNIIFNQQTKKLKFINFGKAEHKYDIFNMFNKNKERFYGKYIIPNIYYPFVCFFMSHATFDNYMNLEGEKQTDFINYLNHIFFDKEYKPLNDKNTHLKNMLRYIDLEINSKNASSQKLKKYKSYIKNNYDESFFEKTLASFKSYYFEKTKPYLLFLKYIINAIDIFGLSLTAIHFFEMLQKTHPIDEQCYLHLIKFLKVMVNNSPSPNIDKTCVPEKAFLYFKKNYNHILNLLKHTENTKQKNQNKKKNIEGQNNGKDYNNEKKQNSELQYKLSPKHVHKHYGQLNKNYINHNGKLMRIFKPNNIFKNFGNLSPENRSFIKKIINEDDDIDNLNILIDKDAYYKIKYDLYCQVGKEVNPYTRRCVNKCPENYVRNFNDFTCTKKNKSIKSNNIQNKKKSKKNKGKCPPGYERNPFTKNCTKKCPRGYIRNLKFNCVNEKDVL